MPKTKTKFVYSFSRRRNGDVTSASFIDKNDGGLSFCLPKNPLYTPKRPPFIPKLQIVNRKS
jgi:hypothetical protein